MNFVKMQGIGNDYVYVDCFKENVKNPSAAARFISDRRFGIGSDGLILICPSDVADCRMEMYNTDGSQGKMCGNGIRYRRFTGENVRKRHPLCGKICL